MFVSLVAVFAGIQFIPADLNQSTTTPKEDILLQFNPPEEVVTLLRTSCYDCHSNNTNYPWYNKLQPAKLLLERHINEAKEELNFNEFTSYSKRKQKSKLKAIISQIEKKEMPLKAYTFIHKNARLSQNDQIVLTHWFKKLKDSL